MSAVNDLKQEADQTIEKLKSSANELKSTASERCHLACGQAKEIIQKNPVPVVIGALAFGAAVGYLILSNRESPSFADRLVRDSRATRRKLAEAPGFLSSLFNDGYEAASRRAEKASDFFHDIPADDVLHSVSHSLNRLRNRIKFW